jgi:hypothetical protein
VIEALAQGVPGLIGGAFFWGTVSLLYLGASAAYGALFLRIGEVPMYLGLSVAAVCLALGGSLFWLRDIRNWRSVAIVQILIAVIAGTVAFFGVETLLSKIIGLVAATVTVANGIKRLRELPTKGTTHSADVRS